MIDQDNRREFERIGLDTVRIMVAIGACKEEWKPQAFEWVAEQDLMRAKKNEVIQRKIMFWTRSGTIAAVIAAIASIATLIPVFKGH